MRGRETKLVGAGSADKRPMGYNRRTNRSLALPARKNKRRGGILTVVLVAVVLLLLWWWLLPATPGKHPIKCVIVGLDGLDPKLTRQWIDAGKLPNLARLAKEGSFSPLATSNPPQSPVAWSSFIAGMNPGGTGIFDFVHRDPETYIAVESMSRVEHAKNFSLSWFDWEHPPELNIGSYRLPLRGDTVISNRQGTPFWKYLEDAGIPAVALRVPCNYPPTPGKTTQISGMGTPDLSGSTGAYNYWTDRVLDEGERDNLRGRANVEQVRFENGRVVVDRPGESKETPDGPRLEGPLNVLRPANTNDYPPPGFPPSYDYFDITIDKANGSIRIRLDGQDAVLKPGEWSEWMPAKFVLADWFWGNPAGMVRFRLKSLTPHFELYATPINIDPANPAMNITNPPDYAKQLAEHHGRFYTLGMPEDDKAMGSRVRALDEIGFRQQCRQVLDDVWKTTRFELDRYRGGFFFTYFRTTDVMSHMLWFAMDKNHPAYDAEAAKYNDIAIQEGYSWVDEKIGEIRKAVGEDALFIVMSDHGFAPFYRQMELNAWLADNGWLTLVPWATRETAVIPDDVDWGNTRAYCLGLNSLYLNVEGREKEGVVKSEEREKVARELCAALEGIVDPVSGKKVISKAYRREESYSGKHLEEAPDILVGYNHGFRTSWRSALGQFPPPGSVNVNGKPTPCYLSDNTGRWSGDHCCDPVHVPGVILMNRKLTKTDPGLPDLAPTILQEYGIAKPADMVGAALIEKKK